MPLVTEYLKTMDARNEQRTSELKASVGRIITDAHTAQSSQLQQLLTSGRLTLRLEAPQLPPPPPPSTTPSSQYTSAWASIAATPVERSPSPQQPQLNPSKHRMYRGVKTVEALWRE